MAADIDPVRVAAEARGVAVDPGDRAADLLGHREQAAAGILHRGEIRRDEMRPGAHEHLGRRGILVRRAGAPRAAVDEDEDRRRAGASVRKMSSSSIALGP